MRGLRACLKRGLGFTAGPIVAVGKELQAKSLVRLESQDGNDETALIMIWHAEKWCSPLLNHFMKLSEEVMSEATRTD